MDIVENICNLNISLEDLYEGKKQVNIHLSENLYEFHLVLKSGGKPDCKISSFGANLWTRTNKGVNSEKYACFEGLQKAVVSEINKNVDKVGKITFSLSEQVFTI